MSNQRTQQARSSSRLYWMTALVLAVGLPACSDVPTPGAPEPTADVDIAPEQNEYAQLIAGFDGSGRADVEAARDAEKAALLLFSASW